MVVKDRVEEYEIYYRSYLVLIKVVEELKKIVPKGKDKYIIICLESDKEEGESLGSKIGSMLKEQVVGENIRVVGVLQDTNKENNVEEVIEDYRNRYEEPFIITVGSDEGDVNQEGLLRIGEGKGKNQGDVSVKGLVSEGVLVKDMAKVITKVLNSFKRHIE